MKLLASSSLVTVALLAACTAPPPPGVAAAPAGPAQPPPQFTVTGTATLDVHPDCADLHVTVSAEASRPGAATKAARARQATLSAALAGLGIEPRDVALSRMSIEPTWDDQGRIRGYRASIAITATTRDFDRLGPMMDAAADAGATSMSTSFRAEDLAARKQEARAMAIAAAKAKAVELSGALDVALGPVIGIAEDPGSLGWAWGVPNSYGIEANAPRGGTFAEAQPLTVAINVTYRLGA